MPAFSQFVSPIKPSLISPNVGNLYIGKGVLSFKKISESVFTDMGNAPSFSFMPKVTLLPHFSSRYGVRIKDLSAVTELNATVTVALEEFTARNLGFAMLSSDTETGSSPTEVANIAIFTNPVIEGALQFVGANAYGALMMVTLPVVQFTPAKAVELIGTTWGVIELTGDVLFDPVSQGFGTFGATYQLSPVEH